MEEDGKKPVPIGCLAFVPRVVYVAKEHGYALALHGSMIRDFDFIAVPWTEEASSSEVVVEAIRTACGGIIRDEPIVKKPHGRRGWIIHLCGGPYIDLSVMPLSGLTDKVDRPGSLPDV